MRNLLNNLKNLIKIIEQIRFFKPEIVFANAIEDRHPDHGRAAQLIAESCFLSGLQKIETKRVEYNDPTYLNNVYNRLKKYITRE